MGTLVGLTSCAQPQAEKTLAKEIEKMKILRKSKETVAGGGLFLALFALSALSLSGVASAGQGCGMQLVQDNRISDAEIVATADQLHPGIVEEGLVNEVASAKIVIEPGTKTDTENPRTLRLVEDRIWTFETAATSLRKPVIEGPVPKTVDDVYIGKTLTASAGISDMAPSGTGLGDLVIDGGAKTDGSAGADGTSLALPVFGA